MSSLRGGQAIWGTTSIDSNGDLVYTPATVADGAASGWALVGPGPYVAIYINNSGSVNATFKVQVAAGDSPRAGLNILDTDAPDGGIEWFDLDNYTSLAVNASATLAINLAPFAPPLVRLVRTDSNGNTTIMAFVSSFGPN